MQRITVLFTLLLFAAAALPAALWGEETAELRAEEKPALNRPAETWRPQPTFKPDRPDRDRPDYGRPNSNGKPPRKPPVYAQKPPKPGQGFEYRPGFNKPRPGFDPHPGFKPPYTRPQWPLGSGRDRYDRDNDRRGNTCPPYCGYYIYNDYRNDYYERDEEKSLFFQTDDAPPEERTYFQGGGFERPEEKLYSPPPAPEQDNFQMDLESYRLMMKAWQ